MSRFSLFLFLFQIFFYPSVVLSVNQDLYLDSSISYEKRIEDLMSKMTLEEKIAQMCQYVGLNYLNSTADNMTAEEILNSDSKASYPGLKAKDIADMIVNGEIGSFLHVLTPKHANQLQELALRSRLKIPLLIGIDAIHGNGMVKGTTIYPSPITIASSFSDKFAFQVGRQTALEMRATGSHWAFTPNVDVLRDPRWGRSGETFGEDPYLVSNLGVNTIKGLQLDDYTGLDKVIACAKHFIAGSDPNNGLNFAPMDVSERTLREIYLKPYKKAIEANVYTMMAAHNEVNGIPSHMHKPLIKGIIRDEYNFNGFFVSDWLDIERLETLHFVANDLKEASYLSVDAGIDMHMHGPYFLEAVRDLVKEGKLNEQRINDACSKILMAKFKLGLFENPFVDLEKVEDNIFTIEHQKTALNIARKSIVLLENNEILPLKKQTRKKILVTGPNANNHSILGDWTKPQPPKNVTTVFEGIKEIGNEYNYQVDYYDSGENIRNITDENIKATANKASEYDYIVLVVGDNSLRHLGFSLESGKTAGENMARADINLAGNQLELVKALNAVGKNLIVVYVNGKAIAEPWITDNVDVLIEAWEPGSFGGQAVAEIIFGDINPSGKLPVTFPRHVGQLQMIYNHKPSQYFKKYAFEKITPLYPFGYGLSYSDFDYSSMRINVYEDDKMPHISIVVDIRNNSDIDGEEIAQLYFRDSISSVSRPVKELVDYKRIYIPAGKTRTVQFTVPIEKLSFYDINMSQCVEPGEFVFMVGSSSSNDDLLVNPINIINRYDY